MNIGGMVKNSFVDYPGKIACVFFTTGCNLRCWYCHNYHLFGSSPKISEQQAFAFLQEHKGFLDGVVVSGGEPTLQPDLVDFVKKIKNMGFLVKLDTNGTNFEVVKTLVENHLVDYVAMDIKAPTKKYEQVVGPTNKLDEIKKTRDYLLQNVVECEFRTTFSPDLSMQDLAELCGEIANAKRFSIQRYNQVEGIKNSLPPRKKSDYILALEIAKKIIPNTILKGVD